ncbi:hypothetical protein BC567DRAFT_215487 [Phyllosticta citribraziliensis]
MRSPLPSSRRLLLFLSVVPTTRPDNTMPRKSGALDPSSPTTTSMPRPSRRLAHPFPVPPTRLPLIGMSFTLPTTPLRLASGITATTRTARSPSTPSTGPCRCRPCSRG